jgi:hypothetical protein
MKLHVGRSCHPEAIRRGSLKDLEGETGEGVKLNFNYPKLRLSWNVTLKKI